MRNKSVEIVTLNGYALLASNQNKERFTISTCSRVILIFKTELIKVDKVSLNLPAIPPK